MEENEPKTVEINVDDQVGVSEVIIATGEGPSGEGVRRVDSEGHLVGIDQTGEDVNEFIAGPTIQGEQGRKATCEILMEKLIELGQDWVRLEEELSTDSDVDCRLYSRRRGVKELEIQVTKADKSIWPELAKGPAGIPRSRSIDAVCESLFQCILDKRHVARPDLVLALEAVHFPVVQAVADEFMETYGPKARSIGFHQIWLVGPTPGLTFQLA